MRSSFIMSLCLLAAAGLSRLDAQVEQTVKVTVRDLAVQEQRSPLFQAGGVKDKVWRPKNWLELDLAMDVKKAKTPGDNTTMVDSLDLKFYIALNHADANKKYYLLTGTMTVLNVPTKVGEQAHALAYVSPNTLRRLMGDNKAFTASADIKAYAVEISYGGQLIGGHTSVPGKWWEDLSKFAVVDGEIVPKSRSPFAPLWPDYDLDVKAK